VTLTVKERPTGTFQAGLGFGTSERLFLQGQVAEQNLLGRGQSLSLTAMFSNVRQLWDAQFYEPYFLGTQVTFALNAFNTVRFFEDFTRRSYGVSPSWGYRFTDEWRFSGTYTLENVNVESGRGASRAARLANLFRGGIKSSVEGTLTYDTRNNRLFPTRGQYHTGSVEWAGPASDVDYTRYTLVARAFYPLVWTFVFKWRGEVGYITSPSSEGVPIQEKYFVGGITTVRGYRLFTISPKISIPSAGGDPMSPLSPFKHGGNKQLVNNFEIEFGLLQEAGIRGVVFFDAGNAYAEGENFFYLGNAKDNQQFKLDGFNPRRELPLGLYMAWGLGIRWFSPLGPLRFEWGFPLTRRPTDEPPPVFEFTIGSFQ